MTITNMSYDLFFYKQKGSQITERTIRNYLTENLTKPNEQNNQWWFENEDTGVYFCFETTDENDFENYDELFECFSDFDNVRFMFNINFVRPDFFGQEAFPFVEKFINDLDLYILNPQSENNSDNPSKPITNELYESWAATNNPATAGNFGKDDCYYPLEESNEIWRHNYNKWTLQAEYDEVYYVPKVYLVKEYKTNRIVTQTSWVEHIPNIFPKADFILLEREKKALLKTTKERGYVHYKTFIELFGDFLNDIEGYKIIHPENSEKVAKLFNTLKFDLKDGKLGEIISWDKVYNHRP
jgi:hypothetical protein